MAVYMHSKRQANAVYRAWKEGRVQVGRETMNAIYALAGLVLAHGEACGAGMVACHVEGAVHHLLDLGGERAAQRELDRIPAALEQARAQVAEERRFLEARAAAPYGDTAGVKGLLKAFA